VKEKRRRADEPSVREKMLQQRGKMGSRELLEKAAGNEYLQP
jgi:hypothetical protein